MRRWFNALLASAFLTFVAGLLVIVLTVQNVGPDVHNSGFEEIVETTWLLTFFSPLAGLLASVVAFSIARKAGESRGGAVVALALNAVLIAGILWLGTGMVR